MNIARFEVREWIDPWRDRRPMTDDPVLVTKWNTGDYIIGTDYYDSERNDWWWGNGTILAWMPLPEPYNPVEEEEEEE